MKKLLGYFSDYGNRKCFLYFNLYGIVFFLINTIVLGVVSAFHFSLGHKLNIVEDWIMRFSWEIIILAKIISMSFCLRMIGHLFHAEHPLIKFLKGSKHQLFRETVVIAVVYYAILFYFSSPNPLFKHTLYLGQILISFWGTFFFYFLDFVYLSNLRNLYQLKKSSGQDLFFTLLYSALNYFYSIISIDYSRNYSLLIFIISFITLTIYLHLGENWVNVFYFILGVIAPVSIIFGLDIIWGNLYSLKTLPISQLLIFAIALLVTTYFYLSIKRKKTRTMGVI